MYRMVECAQKAHKNMHNSYWIGLSFVTRTLKLNEYENLDCYFKCIIDVPQLVGREEKS